jgi:hypothetical protein
MSSIRTPVRGPRGIGHLCESVGVAKVVSLAVLCVLSSLFTGASADVTTCRLTVDNELGGVWYNGNPLVVTGDFNDWTVVKTIVFIEEVCCATTIVCKCVCA